MHPGKKSTLMRGLIAKKYGLTPAQAGLLRGNDRAELEASAQRLQAAGPAAADAATKADITVERIGPGYDGGGTPVSEVAGDHAEWVRQQKDSAAASRNADRDAERERRLRIEERIGDSTGWTTARDERLKKLIEGDN
jgi:hypothetical protein